MRRTISAIASLAAVVVLLSAAPATAGTAPDQLDPHVDVTDVVFNQATDGTAWVDLIFAGSWIDGSWVDQVFSAFVSVDVSNADDFSGLLVQHHDGVWTIAGTYDVGDTTAETQPSLFILDSGGIRLNLGTLTATDLSFLVQSASMNTPESQRVEGRQFAGNVNWANPDLDPRLRATAEFDLPTGRFQAMVPPSFPPADDSPAAADPAAQPTGTEKPTAPAETLSDDDAQALADDLDTRAQEDLPAPSGDDDGSNAVRNFLIIAVLVAFSIALGWQIWRRRLRQAVPTGSGDKPIDHLSDDLPSDDEIRAKMDVAHRKLMDSVTDPNETPPDRPTDLPEDLSSDLPSDTPEDPDDFIDRVL